jgi:hypothetical protein
MRTNRSSYHGSDSSDLAYDPRRWRWGDLVPISPFLEQSEIHVETDRLKQKTDKGWSPIAPGRVELPTSGLGNRDTGEDKDT